MTGFYLMHRGWQDNPVFRNEAFSKRDAFVWLIEEAAYRPAQIHAATGTIDLKRGQLSHSLRFMAKAWRWDEAKVRRFLTSLVKSEIIDAAIDAGQTVVTIRNYDKYQGTATESDAGNDAATTQRRRGGDANLKEGKQGKEGNKKKEEARAPVFSLPSDIPHGPWSEFEAMRIRIRKPLTDHARKLAVARLHELAADGWPPGDVLNNSILNSYQGLFPPKDQRNGNRPANDHRHNRPGGNDGFLNACFDAEYAERFGAGN